MNAPYHFVPDVEPFFFDVEPGTRWCLYHAPNTQAAPRGAILYVHPFAEELNLCRRMAAQQARAFAAMGFAVLQIDLFGCGDSCGEFAAGRWQQWQRDLDVAAAWLRERQDGPQFVWGVRLGALLAMDLASRRPFDGLILWQPLIRGRTGINQFLRQQLSAHGGVSSKGRGAAIRALRAELDARGRVDVGGFLLNLEQVRSIESRDAGQMALRAGTVYWFSSAAMPRRLAANWTDQAVDLHYHQVALLPFWADPLRPECPSLLAATAAAFALPPVQPSAPAAPLAPPDAPLASELAQATPAPPTPPTPLLAASSPAAASSPSPASSASPPTPAPPSSEPA